MTANGHKKFLFDLDFSPDAGNTAQLQAQAAAELEAERDRLQAEEDVPEVVVPTFSEADLQHARDEGYQAGQADATRDLASALEQRLVNTMDAINTQVENLFATFERGQEENSRDAVAVATVIVRKLFPALNMDTAMAEIEHMIIEAMQRTSGSPTLVVRVPREIHEAVEAKANDLAAVRGREGTVTVMIDEAMTAGDVAVAWDGGGMSRDSQLMWQEIDQIIERNLGAERANGATETANPAQDGADAPTSQTGPRQEDDDAPSREVVNEATVGENGENAPESLSQAAPSDEGLADETPTDETTTQDAISGDVTPDGTEHTG